MRYARSVVSTGHSSAKMSNGVKIEAIEPKFDGFYHAETLLIRCFSLSRGSLEITGDGLDSVHWATQEFGDARLGDKRLSQRLVASAARLAEQPGRAFTAVSKSDVAAIKGYYRLIDKPPDFDAVTMDTILAPHQLRTRQRMANEAHVLCIADGTTLNYNGLAECEGSWAPSGPTRRVPKVGAYGCIRPWRSTVTVSRWGLSTCAVVRRGRCARGEEVG